VFYLEAKMASNLYTSVPINTKLSEIRLIAILPGAHDDPISCVFDRHELRTPDLEFRALSYTWGNPSPTHVIFINNIAFTVRQNLWLFLKQERQSKRFGRIWIDALCINQLNTGERNHQVALMKEIYSQVISCYIWSRRC
jgi:hypothetical protein